MNYSILFIIKFYKNIHITVQFSDIDYNNGQSYVIFMIYTHFVSINLFYFYMNVRKKGIILAEKL